MHHKEHKTLDLLGQFSQKNQKMNHETEDKEKILFMELGQLISSADKRGSDSNSTFGIPHFIWYLVMAGMFFYLIKEIFFLNQINDVSGVVSTIHKGVTEGTHKVAEEMEEIKSTAHKALENAKKE